MSDLFEVPFDPSVVEPIFDMRILFQEKYSEEDQNQDPDSGQDGEGLVPFGYLK